MITQGILFYGTLMLRGRWWQARCTLCDGVAGEAHWQGGRRCCGSVSAIRRSVGWPWSHVCVGWWVWRAEGGGRVRW